MNALEKLVQLVYAYLELAETANPSGVVLGDLHYDAAVHYVAICLSEDLSEKEQEFAAQMRDLLPANTNLSDLELLQKVRRARADKKVTLANALLSIYHKRRAA